MTEQAVGGHTEEAVLTMLYGRIDDIATLPSLSTNPDRILPMVNEAVSLAVEVRGSGAALAIEVYRATSAGLARLTTEQRNGRPVDPLHMQTLAGERSIALQALMMSPGTPFELARPKHFGPGQKPGK